MKQKTIFRFTKRGRIADFWGQLASFCLCAVVTLAGVGSLAGCAGADGDGGQGGLGLAGGTAGSATGAALGEAGSSRPLKVIATVFAPYDFAQQVAGDLADVSLLLPPGTESHSFEPTPRDVIRIQQCDLFIYIGGESETWVEDMLESLGVGADAGAGAGAGADADADAGAAAGTAAGVDSARVAGDGQSSGPKRLRLIDTVTALEEEVVEGMEAEEEGDEEEVGASAGASAGAAAAATAAAPAGNTNNDTAAGSAAVAAAASTDASGSAGAEAGAEYDEHIWTSPQNAIAMAQAIAEAISELLPENAAAIERNAAAYCTQLGELSDALHGVVAQSAHSTLVFGDRFPFRYLAEELGLSYYAAFPGCAAESEPKAATIAFLISKVREEKLPVVLKIEFSSANVARVIAEESGAKVLTLHSVHNVSRAERDAGETYLSLMWANVDVLKEALG